MDPFLVSEAGLGPREPIITVSTAVRLEIQANNMIVIGLGEHVR